MHEAHEKPSRGALQVTAGILRRGGRVLIARRRMTRRMGGMWEFPGGKVEPGETPEDALRRELREELGIEVRVGALLQAVEHRYDWGAIRLVAYEVEILRGEPEPLDHDDLAWVPPSELMRYNCTPADLPIIATLRGEDG